MICHDKKFIFIHAPKCAGTSISNWVDVAIDHDSKHWGVTEYKNEYPIEFEYYFKFTVVRNPWERAVSYYFWHQLNYPKLIRSLTDLIKCKFSRDHSHKRMFCLSNSHNPALDYIARFEDLEKDLIYIRTVLDIQKPIPKLNDTVHTHYSHYFTPETKELINSIYLWDIDYFGYKFEDKGMGSKAL